MSAATPLVATADTGRHCTFCVRLDLIVLNQQTDQPGVALAARHLEWCEAGVVPDLELGSEPAAVQQISGDQEVALLACCVQEGAAFFVHGGRVGAQLDQGHEQRRRGTPGDRPVQYTGPVRILCRKVKL